jgi:hypothetical protein
MKKLLSILSVAAVLTACNSKQGNVKTSINDTAGFAEFQQWKSQNENVLDNNLMQLASVAPLLVLNDEADGIKSTSTTKKTKTSSATSRNRSVNSNSSMSSESGHTAKAAKKKGWSKAAKGTVIGAGGGAVLGAVVNKRNRAAGAVIGGVVGGGVGYGIGRHLDKKDGRY